MSPWQKRAGAKVKEHMVSAETATDAAVPKALPLDQRRQDHFLRSGGRRAAVSAGGQEGSGERDTRGGSRSAAPERRQPDVYKIDFPIKPGESTVDPIPCRSNRPEPSPETFSSSGPTSFIVPQGVTSGEVSNQGQEPRPEVYQTSSAYKLSREGSGLAAPPGPRGAAGAGHRSRRLTAPKLYEKCTGFTRSAF
jgi:hypothetical protein